MSHIIPILRFALNIMGCPAEQAAYTDFYWQSQVIWGKLKEMY